MINAQRKNEDRACNCKNSKCIKLYCECFAARLPCGKNCHCYGCHNTLLTDPTRDNFNPARRLTRDDSIKSAKGCACRKSGCTKKYCECYQSGTRCKDTCKCVDCQNNESMTNKRVVTQLQRNTSEVSNPDNSQNLYSLYISQSQRQLDSIIRASDPLSLGNDWLQDCAKGLFHQAVNGGKSRILEHMIGIILEMEKAAVSRQKQEDISLVMEEDDEFEQNDKPGFYNYQTKYAGKYGIFKPTVKTQGNEQHGFSIPQARHPQIDSFSEQSSSIKAQPQQEQSEMRDAHDEQDVKNQEMEEEPQQQQQQAANPIKKQQEQQQQEQSQVIDNDGMRG